MLFGAFLCNPSASSVPWLILISFLSPLWVLLSHLPFPPFSTSLSSLTGKTLTLPQQRVRTHACTHIKKACCLATKRWDKRRPIRKASKRVVYVCKEKAYWPINKHLIYNSGGKQNVVPLNSCVCCAKWSGHGPRRWWNLKNIPYNWKHRNDEHIIQQYTGSSCFQTLNQLTTDLISKTRCTSCSNYSYTVIRPFLHLPNKTDWSTTCITWSVT